MLPILSFDFSVITPLLEISWLHSRWRFFRTRS